MREGVSLIKSLADINKMVVLLLILRIVIGGKKDFQNSKTKTFP